MVGHPPCIGVRCMRAFVWLRGREAECARWVENREVLLISIQVAPCTGWGSQSVVAGTKCAQLTSIHRPPTPQYPGSSRRHVQKEMDSVVEIDLSKTKPSARFLFCLRATLASGDSLCEQFNYSSLVCTLSFRTTAFACAYVQLFPFPPNGKHSERPWCGTHVHVLRRCNLEPETSQLHQHTWLSHGGATSGDIFDNNIFDRTTARPRIQDTASGTRSTKHSTTLLSAKAS
jgi:hypothetical protein